jgi:hypothetical protein
MVNFNSKLLDEPSSTKVETFLFEHKGIALYQYEK